jgi:tetratricopeptide (TPR) repeat protein
LRNKIISLSLISLAVFSCLFTMQNCQSKTDTIEKIVAGPNAIVGDQQCKSCHAKQYNDWMKSDHFKAIQKPTDSTVLGNFNNAGFNADGVMSHFYKKDSTFYINTQGDDGKNHDYPIKYTFGYYPLQQYLVEFPGGKLQATRLSWDSKQNKWFHQYPSQKIDAHDWLHWTGNAQNWNTMCAVCHSTNLKKNYDIEKDTYNTSFDVLNVSCEACHGPGKNHIAYIGTAEYQKGNKIKNSLLQLAKNSKQLDQINTCAPCHALQTGIAADQVNSAELLDNYIPQIPNTERFHADGQVNDEDYTYASFLQSKMFSRGIECSNCHNPHSGKLILPGNQTCVSCHAKTFDSPSHHFHTTNTAGAECKNCHAPSKIYMGNDVRYDHAFRVPRPDLSVQYATPNACNNCHKEKTAKWAADAVVKWYGPKRKYHFAEDLIPGSQLNEKSEAHLLKLLADTSVPKIIQATAINYLGSIHTATSLNTLLDALKNNDAQIKYEALRSLLAFSNEIQDKNTVAALLNDKVRAVRIAAAALVNSFGKDGVPQQYLSAHQNAKGEQEKSLLYQADFAHGNIAIGDFYQQNENFPAAEKFYLRAIQKDSLANLARLQLAVAYSTQGKNNAALDILKMAIHTDPKNETAWYNIALLYSELKNSKLSLEAFDKAYQLKSLNPSVYYNYGLLLQQNSQAKKAIEVLLQGFKINPTDEKINYALAYVYVQNKQAGKAIEYARVLKNNQPNNPEYEGLFKVLGL